MKWQFIVLINFTPPSFPSVLIHPSCREISFPNAFSILTYSRLKSILKFNLPFQLSWNSTLHTVLKPTPLRTSMYILKLSFISHWAVLPRQIDHLFCSSDLGAKPPTHYSSPFIPYPSSSPRLSIHPIAPDTPLFSSAFHIKPPNHNRP